MTQSTVSAGDVGRAEAMFERWIGFDIRGAAPRRLKDFLVARATYLGYETVANYLDDLPPVRPSSAEAQRLVNVLTNGLTAFWRDRQQIDAIASVIEQLHERHGRTVHVWCAGCATGEEAYTVAIAATEREVPVEIIATDVNTDFLDAARRAEFDEWSLRRVSDERRDRWFEMRDDRWALDHSITALVEFRHHNLLDLPPMGSRGAWDVIVCRNVVIYLTREARSRILQNFAHSMESDDAYLFLGSSEQIGDELAPFRATGTGPTFVYRPEVIEPGQSLPFPAFSELPSLRDRSLDEDTADFEDEEAVGKLLQAGVEKENVDDAIACFEAATGYDPFAPEVHALLGHALARAGAKQRGRAEYTKVLFLDPVNWWAAVHLARLFEEHGDRVEARRHWKIALQSLAARPGAPFSPGLSFGLLRDAADEREAVAAEAARALDRLVSGD